MWRRNVVEPAYSATAARSVRSLITEFAFPQLSYAITAFLVRLRYIPINFPASAIASSSCGSDNDGRGAGGASSGDVSDMPASDDSNNTSSGWVIISDGGENGYVLGKWPVATPMRSTWGKISYRRMGTAEKVSEPVKEPTWIRAMSSSSERADS
jgi:hypothetical protein